MTDPPSMRKRTTSGSSTATANNLPPPRTTKAMKSVSAPLTHTRLNRLIYILVLLTTLLAAYYSYRVVQYKSEVGGWWNLALGRRPPQLQTQEGGNGFSRGKGRPGQGKWRGEEESVEDRINALARALGMPSKELASAIAVAVRNYVPPASLSSVAAQESGPAVQAMIKGVSYEHVKVEGTAADAQATGVFAGVVSGMENLVGMDEP